MQVFSVDKIVKIIDEKVEKDRTKIDPCGTPDIISLRKLGYFGFQNDYALSDVFRSVMQK